MPYAVKPKMQRLWQQACRLTDAVMFFIHREYIQHLDPQHHFRIGHHEMA